MKKIIVLFIVLSSPLLANVITVAPEYEDRYQHILGKLRCLVCQNQSIADSPSDLAVDFRIEVKDMLENGSSDQEILDFMSDRYGDFVLYDPPVKPHTWLLWAGPFLFLIGGVIAAIGIVRKRAE
ncbi:MAG: cytochrome c-type biogenesis protein, partial [Pseudomonadota bacterium]